MLVLLSILLVLAGVTGCDGWTVLEEGGCALPEGDDYRSADCAEPGAQRVLAVRGVTEFCRDVPGATVVHQSSGLRSHRYCLGPQDVDPATAINVAQVGDCVAPGSGAQDYVRVGCAGPRAQLQVLHRREGYAVALEECAPVPGTTVEYEWKLIADGQLMLSMDNIYFCFGPAGVDPRAFVEVAQPGDCVKETGGEPEWLIVDCGAPDAAYRVHGRVDGFVGALNACEDTPEATMKLSGNTSRGLVEEPFSLCLGPV